MKNQDKTDPLNEQESEDRIEKQNQIESKGKESGSISGDEITEESKIEAPAETVEESTVEAPAETVEESKIEVPTEAVEESISEAPTEAVEESISEAPTEAIEEAEIEAPTEAVEESTVEAPAETVEEIKIEVPTEAVEESISEAPTETPKEVHAPGKSGKAEEVQERVNYALLSKTDLVKLMAETLNNPSKGNMRKIVDEFRQVYSEKQNAELEEKKAHFLEEGGTLEDFKPAEDPVDAEMKELVNKYRILKAEFTRDLEKTKHENLAKRRHILEDLRVLMETQETFEITFRKFKELQRQWFAAGIVPQQNLKDLWDSYNYFVEKFNDYVRINRDLRALDLKKNLELKIQLCERTEELDKEPNVVQAFKTLQKFHTRWREIGPVPRDNRDEVWDRFKAATSLINRKHQEYHSRLKDSLHENLEKKEALCEKVELLSKEKYESHSAWAEKTQIVLGVQKEWKTIGYAPKKDNNAIYARFRKACDVFFGNKAAFYSMAYNEQNENLKLKSEIVERAESLRDSQDWKATTNELIKLQKQWKEIGPVPRRDSDKLWKRFRAACDAFFTSKSSYFDDTDSTFDDNLKAKTDLIAEMDTFVSSEDRKTNFEALNNFQTRFDAIGYVPSNKKEWIREEFRRSQDRLLEKIGLDESERSLFRFRSRIKGIIQTPRAEMKLNFERDKLVSKLQQLQSDISVWENNIGFFKLSKSSEDTVQGFHEKINSAHERISSLEKKIRILDDMENAN